MAGESPTVRPFNITVDLTHVTAIDDAGRYLLTVLQRDGAKFIATTPLMRALVEEIERRGFPSPGA